MFKRIREALEAWALTRTEVKNGPVLVIPFIDTSTNVTVPSTVKIQQVWS